VLSDAEARALVGCVRKPTIRAATLLMYACGLRIGEAAKVEVADIDGARGVLRVIGKGDKERLVPVPGPVLIALRGLWRTALSQPQRLRADPAPVSLAGFPCGGQGRRH
jgi:site-specific recombinase XerD